MFHGSTGADHNRTSRTRDWLSEQDPCLYPSSALGDRAGIGAIPEVFPGPVTGIHGDEADHPGARGNLHIKAQGDAAWSPGPMVHKDRNYLERARPAPVS